MFDKQTKVCYYIQPIKKGEIGMNINETLVEHYRESIIPIYTLMGLVEINEAYLRQKPTWYKINRELKYFK